MSLLNVGMRSHFPSKPGFERDGTAVELEPGPDERYSCIFETRIGAFGKGMINSRSKCLLMVSKNLVAQIPRKLTSNVEGGLKVSNLKSRLISRVRCVVCFNVEEKGEAKALDANTARTIQDLKEDAIMAAQLESSRKESYPQDRSELRCMIRPVPL